MLQKNKIVLGLFLLLPIIIGFKKSEKPYEIAVKVKLVTMDVSVLSKEGHWVKGLKKDDFIVLEDGVPQKLTLFRSEDFPITVGIIIDTSGSMRNKLDLVNKAVLSFLGKSNPQNQIFVVDFSHDKPELLVDFTNDIDDVRDAVEEEMIAGGGTPLWDSLFLALDHAREGKYHRKAILVITDGEDRDSYYNYGTILRKVRSQETQVYFIGIQDTSSGLLFDLGAPFRKEARREMKELSSQSGGIAFFTNDLDQLTEITATISDDLRHQYRIGYVPSPEGKKFRKLSVSIKDRKNLIIRSRKGYYYHGQKHRIQYGVSKK